MVMIEDDRILAIVTADVISVVDFDRTIENTIK